MLTMRGPEFLAVFLLLSAIVYGVVGKSISAHERRRAGDRRIRDPFEIAFLRGGTLELVRVAAVSLNLRGLLRVTGGKLQTVDALEVDRVSAPIERAVLSVCRQPCVPAVVLNESSVESAANALLEQLIGKGLLADDAVRAQRRRPVNIGIAMLMALAVAKVAVAQATGHSNVGLLIVLAGLVWIALAQLVRERRTFAGRETLSDLRSLFADLKKRRARLPPSAVTELTLIAAVFGLGLAQSVGRLVWSKSSSDSASSTSCGSSGCGGGGGCGGGCGGCGS